MIILTTILFTILCADYDNGKRFKDHTLRYIFRFCMILMISFFQEGNFFVNFLLSTSVFYLIFDYLLNILEERKWNYIGNTAIHDIFWRKFGGEKPQLIFKVLFFIFMLTLKFLL